MLDLFGLAQSVKFFIYLMLSFAFFIGIMLLVSEEAFKQFNTALEREYGLRRRLLPKIENWQTRFVDWMLLKYRLVSGLLIVTASFLLLLLYR